MRADLLPERPSEHPAQSREEVAAIEAFYAEEEEAPLPTSETWSTCPLSFQALTQNREASFQRRGAVASKYSKKSGAISRSSWR